MKRIFFALTVWIILGLCASGCAALPASPPISTIAPSAAFTPALPAATYTATAGSTATLVPPPPTATETSIPTSAVPATPTPIPASWETFSASTLKIQFRYPAEWQAETPLRFSGKDGFVEISLMDYPNSEFDVMRTVCVLEANSDKTAAYGSGPLIADWQGWDPERRTPVGSGCIVMPSAGMPPEGLAQAVLYARYPPPQMPGKLLVLRADFAHFSGILSTLRFQDYTPPTPSNGYYDSPACHQAPAGVPQVALHTGSLEITETAIADKNCDPWNQIDGFQALLNSSEAQAARLLDIQNSLIVRWVDSNTDWVGPDGIGFAYASAPLFSIGAPARVNITRVGQVVDTLAVGQFEPAGKPVHGFWSWQGHWLLEMDSVLVQDGKVMNPILEYAEIFEWHLVNDEPFYFFQKDSSYGISYAGQELSLRYDDIIHGQLCCDPARYSMISTTTGAWFYALREDIWYLVHAQVN